MRGIVVLALTLAAPALAQDNEAERACHDMEKRLLEAKTVRLSFAMTVEVDSREDKVQGSIWLGEGNKAKMVVKGTMNGGQPLDMLMVSDGTQLVARIAGAPVQPPHDTPKGMGDLIRGTLARAGVFAGLFYGVNDRKEPTLEELFQLSDFKLARRDKAGKGEILIIEHKIAFRGAAEKGLITLALDGSSLLPQKRIFTINDAKSKVRVMEVYEGFAVDPKLDASLFELPK